MIKLGYCELHVAEACEAARIQRAQANHRMSKREIELLLDTRKQLTTPVSRSSKRC